MEHPLASPACTAPRLSSPTRWTLGRTPGEQALVAVVKGHDVRGTLTVQAVAPEVKAKAATSSKARSKPVVKKKH